MLNFVDSRARARAIKKIRIEVERRSVLVNILGPKLFFVTGLVKFVAAVARLVCPDLLR